VLYKWQSALPEKAVWARGLGHLINGLFVALVNNYAAIGFLVCSTATSSWNVIKLSKENPEKGLFLAVLVYALTLFFKYAMSVLTRPFNLLNSF
jgi:hypothetical protein